MQQPLRSTFWRNHTSKVWLNQYKNLRFYFYVHFYSGIVIFLSFQQTKKYLNLLFRRFVRGMGPNPVLMEKSSTYYDLYNFTPTKDGVTTHHTPQNTVSLWFSIHANNYCNNPKQKQLTIFKMHSSWMK